MRRRRVGSGRRYEGVDWIAVVSGSKGVLRRLITVSYGKRQLNEPWKIPRER